MDSTRLFRLTMLTEALLKNPTEERVSKYCWIQQNNTSFFTKYIISKHYVPLHSVSPQLEHSVSLDHSE